MSAPIQTVPTEPMELTELTELTALTVKGTTMTTTQHTKQTTLTTDDTLRIDPSGAPADDGTVHPLRDPDPFGDWDDDPDTDPDTDDSWGEELPAAQINADLVDVGDDDGDDDTDDTDDTDDDGNSLVNGVFLGDDRGMSTIEYALGCVAAAALGALLYLVVTSDSVEAALTGIFERALQTK